MIFLVLVAVVVAGYYVGRSRSLATVGGHPAALNSLPGYHGLYVALWCGLPALLVLGVWTAGEGTVVNQLVIGSLSAETQARPTEQLVLLYNQIQNLATGGIVAGDITAEMEQAAAHYNSLLNTASIAQMVVVLSLAVAGLAITRARITAHFRARDKAEKIIMALLIVSSTIAILTTIGLVFSLLFEALRFFSQVSPFDFLFGLNWSPQLATVGGPERYGDAFGAIPLFAGTMFISLIAMIVAVPVGLFAAIYMSEYAPMKVRSAVKPMLEVLAGIPTVVYGFFAALTVAPFVRDLGIQFDVDVSPESALAAGMVMGIMIIPFVSSLSDDVINAVPQSLRDGSYGLGATKSETIRQVILPAALPGIVGAIMLAISRAVGETMIVVMAAGLAANLTINPAESVTTVTVQIVKLLVGDQEAGATKTLGAFALGLVLFFVTLTLNVVALRVVAKYREKYD